jgi:hypothetical protein
MAEVLRCIPSFREQRRHEVISAGRLFSESGIKGMSVSGMGIGEAWVIAKARGSALPKTRSTLGRPRGGAPVSVSKGRKPKKKRRVSDGAERVKGGFRASSDGAVSDGAGCRTERVSDRQGGYQTDRAGFQTERVSDRQSGFQTDRAGFRQRFFRFSVLDRAGFRQTERVSDRGFFGIQC